MAMDPAAKELMERVDEQARVGEEIYTDARAHADAELARMREDLEAARRDGETIGFLKRGRIQRRFDDLMDAIALYKAKRTKEHKRAGLTWERFCEAAGYPVRTANEIIADLRPVYEAFSEKFSDFSGIRLSKIRYLGKSISENFPKITTEGQNVLIGDESIPFAPENIDDINAAIEAMKDRMDKEEKDHQATLKASERVRDDLHAKLVSLQKEVDAAEEKLKGHIAAVTPLTAEEQHLIDFLAEVQKDFLLMIASIRKEMEYATAPEAAVRSLYFLLIFMSTVTLDERLALQRFYPEAEGKECEIIDDEVPPPEMMVSNLPLTRDVGDAFRRYMERRDAEREAREEERRARAEAATDAFLKQSGAVPDEEA